VLEELTGLFALRGAPDYIRPDAGVRYDNGPEFTAKRVRKWLGTLNVPMRGVAQQLPSNRVSGWRSSSRAVCGSLIRRESGYVESFNGKLRDELLDGEIFYTLFEAQVLVARWRRHYNTVRPHSSLGYRPPAPEARQPLGTT